MMVLRTLAMPRDTNPWGDVFGGWVMSQMDIAAGLMAGEVSEGRAATVAVNTVVFHRPVAVGQTICIYAHLVKIGRTSMEIALQVWARDLVHNYEADRAFAAEAVAGGAGEVEEGLALLDLLGHLGLRGGPLGADDAVAEPDDEEGQDQQQGTRYRMPPEVGQKLHGVSRSKWVSGGSRGRRRAGSR